MAFPDLSLRAACSSLPAVVGEILSEEPRTRGTKVVPSRLISGRLLIFLSRRCVRNADDASRKKERPQFPQKSKIETRALSPPAEAGRSRWNALSSARRSARRRLNALLKQVSENIRGSLFTRRKVEKVKAFAARDERLSNSARCLAHKAALFRVLGFVHDYF